jgi:spermidine synthase
VSLALTRSRHPVNLVYGVDLVGASLGCLITLAMLSLTDTYSAIFAVGAVGAAGGIAFHLAARASTPDRARSGGLVGPGVALVALVFVAWFNAYLGPRAFRPSIVKGDIENAGSLVEERWNSFSRISLAGKPNSEAFLWSPSDVAPHVKIDQGYLKIDGSAGTPIYRFNGDPASVDFLRYDPPALAYYIRHQGRSAVIGIGGGRDLLTSHIFGFRDITGVEYNPIFVRLWAHDYRWFTGADHVEGLRLVIDDARSWFARSDEHFDLIQMSLIDTWAATGAGAFTLSENGLYTVNGWHRFLNRLTPTGVFTVSRWFSPYYGDETARISALAMATLTEDREADPRAHIYLVANGPLNTLLVGRSALSTQDLQTLDQTAARLHYRILAEPGRPAADPTLERILAAKSIAELKHIGSHTVLNLTPTWDDNPFFFNQLRIWDTSSLERANRASSGIMFGNLLATTTLIELLVISFFALWAVLIYPTRNIARQARKDALTWCSAYFLAIGVGFMFVEMSLIQRMSLFLGHPVYGLAIVLFSVILATGIGSLVSTRAMPLKPAALVGWPLALAAYVATLPLWMGHVLAAAEPDGLVLRAGVCLAIVIPAGVIMGFMFPTGLRLCNQVDERLAPWLWAVNGAAGVLASSATVLVSIQTSLNVSMWVGAAAYALLTVAAVRVLRLGSPAVAAAPAG